MNPILELLNRVMAALLQAEETIRQQAQEIERLKKQGENGQTEATATEIERLKDDPTEEQPKKKVKDAL